jgi:hypothetical protein
MKNVFNHLKTSGIMSGSGLVSCAGSQFITSAVSDNFWRTIATYVFLTLMGVTGKLVLDRVNAKKETLDKSDSK